MTNELSEQNHLFKKVQRIKKWDMKIFFPLLFLKTGFDIACLKEKQNEMSSNKNRNTTHLSTSYLADIVQGNLLRRKIANRVQYDISEMTVASST